MKRMVNLYGFFICLIFILFSKNAFSYACQFDIDHGPGTFHYATYIDRGLANSNFNTNANMVTYYYSNFPGVYSVKRVLIKPDLSGCTTCANSTGVTALLYVYDQSCAGAADHDVLHMTTDWTPGEATWNIPKTGLSWAGGGAISSADYTSTDSTFNTTIPCSVGSYSTIDISALVTGWLNGTYANYGLMIKISDDDGSNSDGVQYGQSWVQSDADSSRWPYIAIVCTPGTATPTHTPTLTPTPAINITKSIIGNPSTVMMGDTVTYCLSVTNTGSYSVTFKLWDTVPLVTDFVGCDNTCAHSGTPEIVSWDLTLAASASAYRCFWVKVARYPYYKEDENSVEFAVIYNRNFWVLADLNRHQLPMELYKE